VKLKESIDYKYALFLAIILALLLLRLGSYGLAETSEARYAEISREMFLSGDYLNPRLLGIFHFHKPPVTYYLTALGYKLFGINEFGARFFLQVAIILQLLLVYHIANLLFKNKKISFISGLIYFSMPLVLISSRNLTTDAYLTTFIMASIFCWQYYTTKGKLLFLYFFYILVGFALLTKGPVALIFILIYIITYKFILKSGSRFSYHHVLGFLLCIAIGASWYVLVMLENPKLWTYFIETQLLSRINSDSFNRSKPFWYYIPILVGLLLPWDISVITNFKIEVKSIVKEQKETKVLLLSSALILLLFSLFTTKLILYILPTFWMLGIYIATQLYNASAKSRRVVELTYLILLGLFLLGIFACWYFKPSFIQISLGTSILAFIVILLIYVLFYFLKDKNLYRTPILATSFSISLLIISTSVLKNNSAVINSTNDLVDFINAKANGKNKTILVYDYLLTSIPFYTDANQITLKDNHNTTAREVQFQNDERWKETLWDVKDTATISKLDQLSKKKNTFLLVRKKHGLSEDMSYLKDVFTNQKVDQKWIIYYND